MFSVSTLVNNIKQLTCKNNIQSVDNVTDFFNGEVEIINMEDVVNNPYYNMIYVRLYYYFKNNERYKNKKVIDVEYFEVK